MRSFGSFFKTAKRIKISETRKKKLGAKKHDAEQSSR